jgi:hypothetical protein
MRIEGRPSRILKAEFPQFARLRRSLEFPAVVSTVMNYKCIKYRLLCILCRLGGQLYLTFLSQASRYLTVVTHLVYPHPQPLPPPPYYTTNKRHTKKREWKPPRAARPCRIILGSVYLPNMKRESN